MNKDDMKVANFWDDGLDFHRFGYFTDEQNNFYRLTNKGPEQIQYPFEGTIDCILGWSYKSFILKSGDNWYTYSVGKFINAEGSIYKNNGITVE